MSITLMISAAVRSSFFVLRMRAERRRCRRRRVAARRAASPPRRSRTPTGRARASETAASPSRASSAGSPCCANSDCLQSCDQLGMLPRCRMQLEADDDDVQRQVDATRTTASADRFAEALAGRSRRARSSSSSVTSDRMIEPVRRRSGFSTRCAVASAADSVMVMTKSVAAKPSRHEDERPCRFHRGNRSSRIEDAALAVRAHRRRCGCTSAARRTASGAMSTSVAIGESTPAAMNAMLGW